MPFHLRHRRSKPDKLTAEFPGCTILDLTSRGPEPWVKFSPFYPHGGIPVPFSQGVTSKSVEGIWQGLKVFENAKVDVGKFKIANMKGIKRSVRKHGRVLGHRDGVNGKRLLSYAEARREIYLPSYRWVLENKVRFAVEELRRRGQDSDVVLLDYETNDDLDDLSRPLSHVGLVIRWVEGNWPT